MYLIDRIEWPSFFVQLARIAEIRDEVKFRPLVQKWIKRNNDITVVCISIIQLPCHQIEKIFDLLTKLEGFDEKRDSFQKRVTISFSKYIVERFDLFSSALKTVDKIKEKEEWKKELDEILCQRMNNVVNKKGHII